MKIILETPPLLLREVDESDADGFSVLGYDEICAFADLRNEASQHVLTKIGLERGNEFE